MYLCSGIKENEKMKTCFNIFLTQLVIIAFSMNINAQIKSPEPISGFSLTKKIVQNHLIYPKEALENKDSGEITVYYIVDKNGKASNFNVREAFNDECAEEAIRLVKMIEWNPGLKNGKPAEYQDYYTVDFSARSYKKAEEKNPRVMIPAQDYPAQKSNSIYTLKELSRAPQPYFEIQGVTINSYIRSNLVYPDQAKQFEIQGTVKLNFIIETDGRASNIIVENSVGGGCDNEAIRLLQDLVWTPGVKNDSLVRTRSSQEITFQIGDRNYHDGNSY